ncbi:ERMES complex subunit mmm1 [Puccinia graminis f. sp. tritici]|uniref:Maintenance of mitochondrial morphology protein 1 n=1 Tax=Puccinia graminis f. sp. tritici TaxID=56615 RepID=A0A5B0MS72_PUCGR|nr:ERMES complex subunit mmm1 [Puccinia graminis f. sp. tritici]
MLMIVALTQHDNHQSTSSQNSTLKPFQLTFTQGFIVGQLSFLVLVICFVRYVVFEDPKSSQNKKPMGSQRKAYNHNPTVRRTSKQSRKLSFHDKSHGTAESELLSKLPYDLSSHPPETTDWLNVLLAQAIIAYRSLVHGLDDDPTMPKGNKAKEMVEEAMNFARGESPGIISVDYITVTEVEFGKEYPVCTNARVRPADETGRMRIEIDIDYSDRVTLAIETKVVVNFPTARFAVLPISLGLTLNQLSATIMAEIPPIAIPLPMNDDPSAPSPAILMSLDPDFTLSMTTTSLLGSRAKLQDIPKIEQLILGRLRGWIVDNLVWPKVRVLKLPGLGNKGSVEDAADGEGEYVWVEGTTKEKNSTSKEAKPKSIIREADEDEGPSSSATSCEPPRGLSHSTLGLSAGIPLNPKYHRSTASGSSSRAVNIPLLSPSELTELASRQRHPSTRTDARQQAPPDSDGYSSHPKPPGGLPNSARSIGSFPESPLPPTLSQDHLKNSVTHHEWLNYPRSPDTPTSASNRLAEDRGRWARAGGMSGVPLGLGGSQTPNLGYGIRERIREAERLKGLRANDLDDSFTSQR